jgi:hypothetical protein
MKTGRTSFTFIVMLKNGETYSHVYATEEFALRRAESHWLEDRQAMLVCVVQTRWGKSAAANEHAKILLIKTRLQGPLEGVW